MLLRVFSDIHFGDPATQVRRLAQLRPLLDDVDELVLNGDTTDTRPSRRPSHTAECRAEVDAFAGSQPTAVTLLTGNHDPDISSHHLLDLAHGQVLVTHGDILFSNIVPWGNDAAMIARFLSDELGDLEPSQRADLTTRFAIWRRVAGRIPQRHQAEPRGLKYLAGFVADTVWPPWRVLRVLKAWRDEPGFAAEFARRHRPRAKFVILGHTHRPAIRRAGALTIINTGTFCPPFGAYAVDLSPGRLVVRRIAQRSDEFRPANIVAEFPLAAG